MKKNTEYNIPSVGIGSFFNFENDLFLKKIDHSNFLQHYQLFYTGRQALKYIFNAVGNKVNSKTIWLPEYYCQHVTHWLKQNFNNISFYEVDPFNFDKPTDIESFCSPNDIVLLNNFWGLSNYHIPNKKNRAIYIEDHSHGWLSDSCIHSEADYCIASLRKSLPIPLGGILWSKVPLEKPLQYFTKDNTLYKVWDSIEKAMLLKTSMNSESTSDIQINDYLSLVYEAEEILHENHNIVELKTNHKDYIEKFLTYNYLSIKEKHLNFLLENLKKTTTFKVLQYKNQPTFGLELLFNSENQFSNFKSYLIKNKIFPSFLWPNNPAKFKNTLLLNLHIDYRYSNLDLKYISDIINAYVTNEEIF